MKRFLIATALTVVSAFSTSAFAVDISINIGQPDYYGRIDPSGYPQPQILFTEPVVIAPVVTNQTPIYMRVPPGHAKDWGKHCGKYNACGERVFFVRDDWYNSEYAPRYRELHPNDNQGQVRTNRENHENHENRENYENRDNKKAYKTKHYKENKGNKRKGKGNNGHKGKNKGNNGHKGNKGKGRGH